MMEKIQTWFSQSLTNHSHFKDYFKPFIRLKYSSWNRDHYLAKINDIREENADTYTLVLEPSKKWKTFLSGQYIQISTEINGSLMTRTFSLSSSPQLLKQKGLIEITIQKQIKGRVTPLLKDILVKEQNISISKARGDFTVKRNPESFLFIAAGSGITPIKSLINDMISSTTNNINLIYYASNDQHLFKTHLQELEKNHRNLNITFINTSLEKRIHLNQIKLLCPDFINREIFICGPSAMIEATQTLLINENINSEKIHYEYFGIAPIKQLDINNNSQITFKNSNLKVNTKKGQNISLLEMAESSGLKPNNGCRMGVCHQCICKKDQGVIYNTLTKTYSDTGSQEIQLCISIAASDVVLEL